MSSYDPFNRPASQGGGGYRPPSGPPGEDLLKLWHERRPVFIGIGLLLLALYGFSSALYTVEEGHVGVVLRFGEHQENTAPGLHYKIPFGVDEVESVAVQKMQKMVFGYREGPNGLVRTPESGLEAEMLTGDTNVATVEWSIQYKIESPEKYLLKFRDVESTLSLLAEATMRTIVGDYSFEELLTEGRTEIQMEAKALLVKLNALYDTGITILRVDLEDTNAPEMVKPALREVEEAKQERERMKKEALADYNKEIPKARGQALEVIEKARGYSVERINMAKGDSARFNSLYSAYRRAPEVTRTRLYLEAMTDVLAKAKQKVIVDPQAKSLLPLIHLNQKAK